MMKSILLDVNLPFGTPEEQDASEDILMRLLGVWSRLNHQFLLKNPSVLLLYESGVQYALPDQLTAPPIDDAKMKRIVDALRAASVDDETVVGVLRLVRGQEIFRDVPTVYQRGKSDCNDLACIRVGELWRAGIDASPALSKRPNSRGGVTYHAIVAWPDGSTEDPSLILGMSEAEPGERDREIDKNEARLTALLQHTPPHERDRQGVLLGLVPRGGFQRGPYAHP